MEADDQYDGCTNSLNGTLDNAMSLTPGRIELVATRADLVDDGNLVPRGQKYRCGRIGGDSDLEREFAVHPIPADFDWTVH